MGPGGGEPPAGTGEHDARRAVDPGDHHRSIVIGIPFNYVLGGTRTALQRIAIALISVPATVVLAVGLFTFNALVPDAYAALLRFADLVWQASLNALSASGDTIPGARKLTNAARQGFSGIMCHVHDCVLSCERALRIRLRRGENRSAEVARTAAQVCAR